MKVVNVTTTLEERNLLHAALADFSHGGARARYAAWLEARGDQRRAEVVRATIEAFHHLSLDAIRHSEDAADWERMIAVPMLKTFIRGTSDYSSDQARALRDLVFPRLRPALYMTHAPAPSEPEIGASYLWGLPDMAEDEAWPKTRELSDWFDARSQIPQDLHCGFLCQIAFADMKDSVLGRELPSIGGFAVFQITEADELGIVEVLVRPWARTAALARRAPPPDLVEDRFGQQINSPQSVHVMELREVLSLPDARDGPFAKWIPDCGYGERHDRVYSFLQEACDANVEDHGGYLGFGGYLKATSGNDPSLDTQSLRLAVLPSSPEAGLVHFAIPADDLEFGHLDRVQYVWNDWDL